MASELEFQEQSRALETANAALRHCEQLLAAERDSAERLQHVATQLINVQGTDAHEDILDATVAVLHADFASIQMFHPERGPGGELRLLGHRGFSSEAAKRWEWVGPTTRTVCGEALRTGQKIAVADVRNSDFMAGSEDLDGYLDAGIRAGQTLPLVSRSGALLGMVSTYWREPHELSASELRVLDVLARLAADLIERSRAEEDLRASEERLRFAQEMAGIGTFDSDVASGVGTWTTKLKQMYGLQPSDSVDTQADWLALIHPEDRDRVAQRASEGFRTGTPVEVEWRVIWPDGSVHWLAGRWRVFEDSAGKPVRVMGVNIDVTASKQMAEALSQSEERFRLAVKATKDAIWDSDIKTGTVRWNETYSELYGRPSETSISWQWWIDSIHPEDRERAVADLRAAVGSAESSWSCEYRFRRLDGTWAYIYDRAYIARDASGNAVRVIGAMQDTTERKQAESKLREAEQRFRKIADAAPVMIWISGLDKLCTFFNKSWLEFRGRSLEQELGNGWTEGVHPNDMDRCFATYSSAFDARSCFQMEYRVLRADGEYRWVVDNGAPLFKPDGVFEGYIGSCVDITELKHSQEENLDRQKLEGIGVLAAGIAHDFNNLLGGILAQAELVLNGIPAESAAGKEIQKVKDLAIRGSEIVRELMVYAGRETTTFVPVDVSRLVGEMLELLKISISKRVILRTDLGKNLPAIMGQTSQIRQLVMNLVTNASEAIGDQEGVITVTTSLAAAKKYWPRSNRTDLPPVDYVRLDVSDTGSGMTKEEKSKIFDPFYTTKFAGRGLGLAVVQGVVRAHDGAIELDSAPRQGTSFRVFFPSTQQLAVKTDPPDVSGSAEYVPGASRTVLLVEDEYALREPVAKMLRKKGFHVIEAADGSIAIDALRDRKHDIHVILLDLTIPGADSHKVVKEAQQIRPEVSIVITSAYGQEAALHLSNVPQVAGYIRKPFLIRDLFDLLAKTARLENV